MRPKWLFLAILTIFRALKRCETECELHYWGVSVRVGREISFPTVQTVCLYDAYKPRELPKRSFWRVDFGALIRIYKSICRLWLDDVVDGRDLPFPKLSLDVP